MKKEEFTLGDMKKRSWATTFEKEAMKLPGVKGAAVDAARNALLVEYDENAVSREQIEKAIAEVLARFQNKGFA